MYDTETAPADETEHGAEGGMLLTDFDRQVLAERARAEQRETDEENYVTASDPHGHLREYAEFTLSRIEKTERMLDRLANEIMDHCGERRVDDKSLKQTLDKTRMATSLIRGYQHLIAMREDLIARDASHQQVRDAARAEYRARLAAAKEDAAEKKSGAETGSDADTSPICGGSFGGGGPIDAERNEAEGASPASALTDENLPETARRALKTISSGLKQTASMRSATELTKK